MIVKLKSSTCWPKVCKPNMWNQNHCFPTMLYDETRFKIRRMKFKTQYTLSKITCTGNLTWQDYTRWKFLDEFMTAFNMKIFTVLHWLINLFAVKKRSAKTAINHNVILNRNHLETKNIFFKINLQNLSACQWIHPDSPPPKPDRHEADFLF